jgi:cytochrome c oxidase subunit II
VSVVRSGGLALMCVGLAWAGCDETPVPVEGPEAPVAAPEAPPAGLDEVQWGERLFQEHGCTGCHHINGVRGVGGALNGVFDSERPLEGEAPVTADEAYLRESILDPSAKVVEGFEANMPSYRGILNDAQVEALVAYLRSIG